MVLDHLQRQPGMQNRLGFTSHVPELLRLTTCLSGDTSQRKHIAIGGMQFCQRIQYQRPLSGVDGGQ